MQIQEAPQVPRARKIPAVLLVFAAFLCLTCSSGSNGSPGGGGSSSGGDGSSSGGGTAAPVTWSSRSEIDADEAGWNLQLRVNPDKKFSVLYYKKNPIETDCTQPILGGGSSKMHQDTLRYAYFDGTEWKIEDIAQVQNAYVPGISLSFSGTAAVAAFLGGQEASQCCGGSDLMMAQRTGTNQWTTSTVVADSNAAAAGADCPVMQSLCDTGDTVGLWPSLVRSPDGKIHAAYRDIHLCYAKTDLDASDLQIAIQNGTGWTHEWIDLGRGAGDYTQVGFKNNQPAVVYYIGRLGAILFATKPWKDFTQMKTCTSAANCVNGQTCASGRCSCQTDAQCATGYKCLDFRCSAVVAKDVGSLPDNSLSFVVDKDGRFLVAYFDGSDKSLKIAHSTDGLTWESGIVDSDGVTGYSPSMVLHPTTGLPGIAYYRCADAGKSSCDRNQDGPRFAAFTGTYPGELTQTAKWKKGKIQATDDKAAFDGAYVSADVQADGTLGVAYTYNWVDNGVTKYIVMFHQGTWK